MIPRVTATIDLGCIQHNLTVVRGLAPRSRVMAAVKADAYGHGAVPVARALEAAGVDALAVACLEEAMELRQAHVVARSEEHTSELQSLMRISYAVFCLKKKKKTNKH